MQVHRRRKRMGIHLRINRTGRGPAGKLPVNHLKAVEVSEEEAAVRISIMQVL